MHTSSSSSFCCMVLSTQILWAELPQQLKLRYDKLTVTQLFKWFLLSSNSWVHMIPRLDFILCQVNVLCTLQTVPSTFVLILLYCCLLHVLLHTGDFNFPLSSKNVYTSHSSHVYSVPHKTIVSCIMLLIILG